MVDKIFVRELEVWCSIGINDGERFEKQPLYVDIELPFDLRPAGLSDELAKTIDYRLVCDEVQKIAQSQHITIEGLAEKIAAKVKAVFPVKSMKVGIKKPRALARRGAKFAAIEIER